MRDATASQQLRRPPRHARRFDVSSWRGLYSRSLARRAVEIDNAAMRALVIAAWLCVASVAEAGVAIAGLSGDAQFAAAAPGAWSHTFVVYEPGSALGEGAISVRITDFQSDSGRRAAPRRPIEVTWLGDDGARHDAASFAIAVTLPEPDLYIATLVIDASDQPPL